MPARHHRAGARSRRRGRPSTSPGPAFHDAGRRGFPKLTDDPADIAADPAFSIAGFSSRARDMIEYFGLEAAIERLDRPT